MDTRRKRDGRDHCARVEADDGIDPRLDELRDRAEARRAAKQKPGYRDDQLAKVAARAIEQELCPMAPAIEHGLGVVHVEVIGAGSHLRVRVAPSRPVADPRGLESWLAAIAPRIRAGLGHTLARKRVPTLSLELVSVSEQWASLGRPDEGEHA